MNRQHAQLHFTLSITLSLFLSFTCPSFPHPLFLYHRKKKLLNKEERPWPLKYRAENLPRLMGVIDLFDTLWIYEVASQVWETNKAQLRANKQVAIQPDTSQRLRRACLSLLLLPCWGKALRSTQTVSLTQRAAVTEGNSCWVSQHMQLMGFWLQIFLGRICLFTFCKRTLIYLGISYYILIINEINDL